MSTILAVAALAIFPLTIRAKTISKDDMVPDYVLLNDGFELVS